MKRTLKTVLATSAVAASLLLPASGASAQGSGTTLYGLTTTNRIVTINTAFSVFSSNDVAVTGLAGGEQLIGIDRRPNGGLVYGVARAANGTGRLLTVDPSTGATSPVAPLVAAPVGTTPRGGPITLSGNEFGFDFNPQADALRIVSDTGQNLRVIPSNRAALLTGDTFGDGVLNADITPATGVSGAAYTNNVAAAPSTKLYDIDTRRDLLVEQTPPNNGTLVTVGSLRFPVGSIAGFDIVTTNGVDTGYAALTLTGRSFTFLTEIDLATGRARVLSIAAYPQTLRGLTA